MNEIPMQSLILCKDCKILNYWKNEKCTKCGKSNFRSITIKEFIERKW